MKSTLTLEPAIQAALDRFRRPFSADGPRIAGAHHEKYDGTGYPAPTASHSTLCPHRRSGRCLRRADHAARHKPAYSHELAKQ